MDDDFVKGAFTRRQTLAALATSGAAVLPVPVQAQPAAANRLLPGANVCVLTAQEEDGPFYFDPKLQRADITEGKTGVPLGLLLQVVEAHGCAPLKGARIDVWHADAIGYYSGYPGQGDAHDVSTSDQHFLRGTQLTNDEGQASFTTIYPGWYRGRTAHIHCKVFLDDRSVLTTQLYFPDALSEYIYRNIKPYNTRAHERDTVNATDYVIRVSGNDRTSFCNIREEADRYLASLVIGVDRDARPGARPQPGPPPPGGPAPSPRPAARPKASLVPVGVANSK
jgi:protocatechuate 3,4-dioxygenase beta subunit